MAVVLVQLIYLFNCRSLQPLFVFAIGLLTNGWTIVGSLAMLGAQLLFTYVSVMNKLFHSAPVSGESWLRIDAVSAGEFAAAELGKWIRLGRRRDNYTMPE